MKLSTSYKRQALVGLFMSVWLITFLVFIAPFDASTISFSIRLQLMNVYGIIFFGCYIICIPVQNFVFSIKGKWSLFMETVFYLFFYLIVLPLTLMYYKSDIVNGDYLVTDFILLQFIPILFIVTPILFLLRRIVARNGDLSINLSDGKIMIQGQSKQDILKLDIRELICVSSADNYVEVLFINSTLPKKKILRTTLKTIENDLPYLIKVHRSHLINPMHFISWNGKNEIEMSHTNLPVSKKYRDHLMASVHSPQKGSDSSL